MTQGRIRIGTSGWSYDHWAETFYPAHLSADKRLEFLASRFDTVEINATFYRLPTEHAVREWHDEVPDDFSFAVKGSRLITHYRRLADIDKALDTFLAALSPLAEKLGVILWQLPPTLKADNELLDAFLARLPTEGPRHAIEFRHESWLQPETFEVLRKHGAANVQVSSDAMPENLTTTADFAYIRFHGTAHYHGEYRAPQLEPWAEFLAHEARAGRDCYVYFNNDAEGHAPKDAARLAEMLGVEASAGGGRS